MTMIYDIVDWYSEGVTSLKREDEITVTIRDANDKTFSREWKNTDDKRNAIRWTLENEDIPYYLDIANIVSITVN